MSPPISVLIAISVKTVEHIHSFIHIMQGTQPIYPLANQFRHLPPEHKSLEHLNQHYFQPLVDNIQKYWTFINPITMYLSRWYFITSSHRNIGYCNNVTQTRLTQFIFSLRVKYYFVKPQDSTLFCTKSFEVRDTFLLFNCLVFSVLPIS